MIDVEKLSFSYDDEETQEKKFVIKELDLHIDKGSFVAVLGHNGSGKSTFAKHLNGILLPSGGKVYVAGMDTQDENHTFDIRKTAGMVFQNPDNQIVAAIVEDEVAFAPENLGIAPDEIRKRVDECLKIVNMSEFANSTPSIFSLVPSSEMRRAPPLSGEWRFSKRQFLYRYVPSSIFHTFPFIAMLVKRSQHITLYLHHR